MRKLSHDITDIAREQSHVKSHPNRIWAKVKFEVDETQAGFRPEKGTHKHPRNLRLITERARARTQPLYTCFVDFEKAFDTVAWTSLNATVKGQRWGSSRARNCGFDKYLRSRSTDLRQIHTEDVWGPAIGKVWRWRSKVKSQGHNGQKRYFMAISVPCVRFVFDKTSSLASLLTLVWETVLFYHLTSLLNI